MGKKKPTLESEARQPTEGPWRWVSPIMDEQTGEAEDEGILTTQGLNGGAGSYEHTYLGVRAEDDGKRDPILWIETPEGGGAPYILIAVVHARLISAAPELLVACKRAEAAISRLAGDDDILKEIRAAIDIAEGRISD